MKTSLKNIQILFAMRKKANSIIVNILSVAIVLLMIYIPIETYFSSIDMLYYFIGNSLILVSLAILLAFVRIMHK